LIQKTTMKSAIGQRRSSRPVSDELWRGVSA